jgi:hypothetical protein
MTKVDDYLAELGQLLADVDSATREGLLEGIREELAGLTPTEAEARLRTLGDPAFVAASARVETPATTAHRRQDAVWYSVVTVLLLTVGGVVVPVVGGITGLVMLWAAKSWTPVHKGIGTVLALLGPGMLLFYLLPVAYVATTPGEGVNPTLPATTPVVIIVALLLVWLAGWIWLLVVADRARRS